MEPFVADQSEYAGAARKAVRRDLCILKLVDKDEAYLRPQLKRRIMRNLKELQTCNILIDWVLERPDDADAFIIKV